MVDMKLSNKKLVRRAESMIMEELNVSHDEAKQLLEIHGNVRNTINAVKS